MKKIVFPQTLDTKVLNSVIAELDKTLEDTAVEINLNAIEFTRPTSMLVLGIKLRNWSNYRKNNRLSTRLTTPTCSPAINYMAHMGFFDLIGSKKVPGNKIGQAKGSDTYVPISKISRPKFTGLSHWYEDIVSSVRSLANVLAGSPPDSEESKFYVYTLRELVRNVFEHSGANECYICGQRWGDGTVEIIILDEGIGISKSLARSYPIKTEEDALKSAIKPGISSTSKIGNKENIYDNSGFGLYVLSEIASSFGKLTLASNTKRMELSNNNEFISDLKFSGTFLGLELNRSPKQFSSLLKDIIESGELETQHNGNAKSASKMSKLIQY